MLCWSTGPVWTAGDRARKANSPAKPQRRPNTRGDTIATSAVRVVSILALLLATQLQAVTSGPTYASVPPYKLAFFNNPLTGQNVQADTDRVNHVPVPGAPSQITTAIVGLFESAAKGSTIEIAMYQASDGNLANGTADTQLIKQAIKNAAPRVRAINVLTDGFLDEDQEFWDQIDKVPHVNVKRCNHACYRQGHALMHNKFMLVDNTNWTPGVEDVVLQMTANWRNSQLSSRLWNSALQMWGDKVLYAGYHKYFTEMWGCAPSCIGEPQPQSFDGKAGSGVHVTLFPHIGVDDPLLTELDGLDGCSGAEVDIAMNGWIPDARGLMILQKLEDLAAADCLVRIVVQKSRNGDDMGSILPTTILGPTSHCSDVKDGRADTTKLAPPVHSKYMLIRGTYLGHKATTVVSTGSERFVGASLNRADETWVQVVATANHNPDNASVYAAYHANFDAMWTSTPTC